MQVACDSRTLNTDLEIKVLTTAMAAAQQAAQHAVTAARTSYEKVTGSPFQDIGRLDDYAADVVRALGDVDLLKSHFTGRALGRSISLRLCRQSQQRKVARRVSSLTSQCND